MRWGARVASCLAVVAVWSCQRGPGISQDNGGGGGGAVASEPITTLSLGAKTGLPVAAGPNELRDAMRERGQPEIGGALEPIAHLSWRGRSFGPDIIAEAIGVQSCLVGASRCNGFAEKKVFTGKHGVGFDDFWAMLMAGYAAAFEARFGVDVQNVYVAKIGAQLTLGMRGLLADAGSPRTYSVTWKAGAFVGHGVATTEPRPPYAKDPLRGKTLDTVVEIRWHYYVFPSLRNAQVQIRRTDADRGGKGIFFKSAQRIRAERATYATESGATFEAEWPIAHAVPTVTVGLGANNRFGLRNRVHLVRVTFADDDALDESTPLVDELEVLDDGQTYPFDVSAAYAQATQRAEHASRAAQASFAKEAGERQQRFEAEAREFASRFAEPKHRAQISVDDDVAPHASFDWNGDAGTLTIAIHTERRVTHEYVHYTPNPEAQSFRCPDGRPCAIPPAEIARRFSRSYSIHSSVIVTVDSTGAILNVDTPPPTLSPMS